MSSSSLPANDTSAKILRNRGLLDPSVGPCSWRPPEPAMPVAASRVCKRKRSELYLYSVCQNLAGLTAVDRRSRNMPRQHCRCGAGAERCASAQNRAEHRQCVTDKTSDPPRPSSWATAGTCTESLHAGHCSQVHERAESGLRKPSLSYPCHAEMHAYRCESGGPLHN